MGTTDINYGLFHGGSLNDTVAITSDQYNVTFWDISDNSNWELISNYTAHNLLNIFDNFSIMQNYMVLLGFGKLGDNRYY